MAVTPTYEQLKEKLGILEKKISHIQLPDSQILEARRNYKRFLKFLPYPVLVRDANGIVSYVNPSFTRSFEWTAQDLKGQKEHIWIPESLKGEIKKKIKNLPVHQDVLQFQTQRTTRSGKIRDVMVRIGVDKTDDNVPGEMILVFKDITMELRNKRSRDVMNRISQALPKYPDLEALLFYINTEIKDLINTEGSDVILLDKAHQLFYFASVAHDDPETRDRIKNAVFSVDELLSGKVIKTGAPMMINDYTKFSDHYHSRKDKIGYTIENILLVPLRIKDQIIGVLSANNKKTGDFDNTDLETLNTLAATVALSIENAQVSRELRDANEELTSLNRAKDKMISHLSHELKTPVAILLSSIKILTKKLKGIDETAWQPTLKRIERNLNRIVGIEDEIYDIVENKEVLHRQLFSLIMEQCGDELESLIAEETGEKGIIAKVREKIDTLFIPEDPSVHTIDLSLFVNGRIKELIPQMSHRNIEIVPKLEKRSMIKMPGEPLRKTVDGLIRNAVENTPDNGSIEVIVTNNSEGVTFQVIDHGIGLTEEAQKRIFEGFFTVQDTLDYSSKNPFDFNAGGKGADLLRMKIFSERYNFNISMTSRRCPNIPENKDRCPGTMLACDHHTDTVCGGKTVLTCFFPAKNHSQ